MAIVRIILAFLISLSVATLPVAAGTSFNLKPPDVSASQPMDDGCPHAGDPGNKAAGDCASMCALKCFNFYGPALSDPALLPIGTGSIVSLLASQTPRSQSAGTPFRPPRV
jgi:hypothetical protein